MSKEEKIFSKYVLIESNPSSGKEEIRTIEFVRIFIQAWKTILAVASVCIGLAVVFALKSPEVYSASTLLAPAQEDETGATSLLNKFGGLVAIAGVKDKSSSFMSRVTGTLSSRPFLESFIKEYNLLPQIFEKEWDQNKGVWIPRDDGSIVDIAEAVFLLKSNIDWEEDKKTLLYKVTVKQSKPELAANICNNLVTFLNKKFQDISIEHATKRETFIKQELTKTTIGDIRSVLFSMLQAEKQKVMLANINNNAAFEVIEPAVAPLVRDKPRRKMIVVFGGVCGVFLGFFVVLLGEIIKKLKSAT